MAVLKKRTDRVLFLASFVIALFSVWPIILGLTDALIFGSPFEEFFNNSYLDIVYFSAREIVRDIYSAFNGDTILLPIISLSAYFLSVYITFFVVRSLWRWTARGDDRDT